ncbi:MAG: bifunctional phosphoribosyl-AMP cyclohydrolase/phosphoribosyl-ATP diphosphatase HisIE [Oscillospiraceae bacterium]
MQQKETVDTQSLRFDERGLIPAVVQHEDTGEILMLAYMNAESLALTLQEGKTCFWSRSRQELWRKGATSGNTQTVVGIDVDCDADTLVVRVRPAGPACHTGETSCFYRNLQGAEAGKRFSLSSLYNLVEGRSKKPVEGSYTSYLFEKGREKILKKVGEENTEVVIAAMKNDKAETVFELADVCYHLLVLMAEMGISPAEVQQELASRHVVDKKVKQETLK